MGPYPRSLLIDGHHSTQFMWCWDRIQGFVDTGKALYQPDYSPRPSGLNLTYFFGVSGDPALCLTHPKHTPSCYGTPD